MVEFEFLDETLDINSTSSYHLSIQAGLDGLSFCILDTVRNKYVALKNYPNTGNQVEVIDSDWISSILKEDEFLNQKYKSAGIFFVGLSSTLVPDPLFRKENLADYLNFNLDLAESDEIHYNKIQRADAWSIYPVLSDLIKLFRERFPGINIFHHSVPFINHILLNNKGESKSNVYVNLYGNIFDIAVTRSKNLKLYNCFPYKHVNDLLYFILYIFEQMKLPPDNTLIHLSGKVTRQSSFYENLRRYVKKLEFLKPDPHFTYSYTFSKLPEHSYTNLLSLYLCV